MSAARDLTQTLGGKWYRRYGAAPCPVCQPDAKKRQNALTLADGSDGRLLAHCKRVGCSFADILAAMGICPGDYRPPDPSEIARRDAERKKDAAKRATQARHLWQETQDISGSVAETYLRARGITCGLPETLHFHPACWHGPTATRHPALVASVEGGEGFAVHRTYLSSDGSGKATLDPAKAMLGAVSGGAVKLACAQGPLVVSEGIETGLSLACGLLRAPATIWAALSTSGMRGLKLPPEPSRLTIAPDGDTAGRDAAHALAERATAAGWAVSLLPAPDGRDWNDILTHERGTEMNAPDPIPFKPEGPQPLVREIAAGASFPSDNLGPLCAAVEAVQGMTQAPIAIPAASALTVASLAVQGFADVETLGGPRPVSLYALTIARSGERKSSCDGPLMAALRDHEREQARAQRDSHASWQNTHALWKGERDRILAEAKKSKGERRTAAQADLSALGTEPSAPPSADRTVTEPTFEGLTRLFATGQPSLGIFSDEGGQFLGGHAMNTDNRQKTLAALNDLWQGNPIRRTRSGDGHSTLFGRRLAVHLMVQPAVARAFMADRMAVDTGFLPRFLICEPSSTIGTRLHANARYDRAALGAFDTRLQAILDTPMPIDDETSELTPRALPLASEARSLLIGFADAIEAAQAPGGNLAHVTGYASKAAEQAARIAGVLTLWRDLNAPEVSVQDMGDGITLAQFYLGEAMRLADAANVSQETDRAETLRKWLLKTWDHPEIMVRDVVRLGPNALRESQKVRAAIAQLERHGWLVAMDAGTIVRGAARKEAWRIVRGGGNVV